MRRWTSWTNLNWLRSRTLPPTRALATYRDFQQELRRRSTLALMAVWKSLGSYNEADVERFLTQARPIVEGARQASARSTEVYLSSYTDTGPQGLPAPEIRRGATVDDVYRRPFEQVWRDLGAGRLWADAVRHGQARAVSTLNTDIQLASTQTTQLWIETQPAVTGYRRVLGPGVNCGLCIAASSQRYRRGDLMAIHNNCGCVVAPLFDGQRPDRDAYDEVLRLAEPVADRQGRSVTDRRVLSRVRMDGGGRDGPRVLHRHGERSTTLPEVRIREHGELGPTLTDASHSFTQL